MMKKMNEIKTTTFDAGNGFLVDIVSTVHFGSNDPIWDAYLYRKNNGTKSSMFGMMRSNTTRAEFKAYVEDSLDEYMADYDEEQEMMEQAYCEKFSAEHHHCDDDNCKEVVIKVPALEGDDADVEKAGEIRYHFLEFLHDQFITKDQEKIIQFAQWMMENCKTAKFWINHEHHAYDMFFVVDMMRYWEEANGQEGGYDEEAENTGA